MAAGQPNDSRMAVSTALFAPASLIITDMTDMNPAKGSTSTQIAVTIPKTIPCARLDIPLAFRFASPMRIATWNVNSVNARLETVLSWFEEVKPDVACLQEIKCIDEKFPREAFERLGYNVETHGQKTYNGVALLSRYPLEDVRRGLPGDDGDEQARYIEALVAAQQPIRIGAIYLPNGNPVSNTEKFAYKLAWFERLRRHAAELMELEEPLVLAGDYNVIPEGVDCYDPRPG